MLPTFSAIVSRREAANARRIRELVAVEEPLLGDISSHIIHEGKGAAICRPDGKLDETDVRAHSGTTEIPIVHISEFGAVHIERILVAIASQFAASMSKSVIETISEGAEKVGNIVDGGGRALDQDMLLEALSALSHSFDEHGNWQAPTMVVSPKQYEKLKALYEKSTEKEKSEYNAKLNKILETRKQIMIASKLVESWLDKQGERQYQPAFVQLLIAEGWRILHNTRHSPLEFGKDVIARDPNGQLFAIQLKGNPGTRLTKSQAQSLLPQFREGIISYVPRSLRATDDERHVFVLCTNGDIDEEARVLLENAGEISKNELTPGKEVQLWTRGDLLQRFSAKLENIWPSSIGAISSTLQIFTHNGLDTPEPKKVAIPLHAGLRIQGKAKSSKKNSAITSTFLMTEIIKRPWYETSDHYSLFLISILSAIAAASHADSKERLSLIRDYSSIALNHAYDLIQECKDVNFRPGKIWAQGNLISEFDVMGERLSRIGTCAAALVLSDYDIDDADKEYIRGMLKESFFEGCLWGQGAIPSLILRFWAYRRVDASSEPEKVLVSILASAINAAKVRGPACNLANASPYYRFEEVLHLKTGGVVGEDSDIREDNSTGRSAFAMPLMYLASKRNLKQTCKRFWRANSNLLHERTDVPDLAFLSPLLSDEGRNLSHQVYAYSWKDLVNEAIDMGDWEFGSRFAHIPWLLGAYVACIPYRASPKLILFLDTQLSSTWYHENYRPR